MTWSRSNAQASESSYQLDYDLLSLFSVITTSAGVLRVLLQSVPEVLRAFC